MNVTIAPARGEEDIAAVRALCRQFEQAMRLRYADQVWLVESYFDPEAWFEELRDLENRYAAPSGEMLLARAGGQPAGCVMMSKLEDGICEMKRLFVIDTARGHRLGRKLCDSIISIARERGYGIMRLDTGFKQPEAKRLYEKLGFVPIAPYYPLAAPVAELLDFMELRL